MRAGPTPPPGRLVVLADVLIDGTGDPPQRDVAVRVVDGRIVAIEGRGPDWSAGEAFAVIDGHGMSLLPGLIDTHVHLAFPPEDVPADLTALEARAQHLAAMALAGGVTTIRDLGSTAGIAMRVRDQVAAGAIPGSRILAGGAPVTIPGGHCHWFGEIAETRGEVIAAIDRLADQGADVIKVMATGGMASPRSDPYTAQYALDVLAPAVEHAHRRGLPVAAHALCTAGVRIAVAAGVDTLEHGWTITGRRQDYEPSVATEMAAAGTFGSVTTHDALRTLLPGPHGEGGDVAEIRRRIEPHRGLAAAGVPLVVHSDAGVGTTRFHSFTNSLHVYALGIGASNVEAIRAATGLAAQALGLAHELGTVEVGRVADLVLVDGDASVTLPTPPRLRRVIQGGVTVGLDARLVS